MKRIESKENKALKHLRSLGQKKYRDASKHFVIEGFKGVLDILGLASLHSMYIEEDFLLKKEGQTIIETLAKENLEIPIYILPKGVSHQLQFTENSQGIWAIAYQQEKKFSEVIAQIANNLEENKRSQWLLLDEIQDPGNLGTLIRTALAAGVEGLILTKGSVDIYNPKVVRSTMSSILKLPIYRNVSYEELEPLFSMKGLHTYGLTPLGEKDYRDCTYKGQSLFILGNEAHGISNAILSQVDQRLYIPLIGDIESLNIAIAGAIVMYKAIEY